MRIYYDLDNITIQSLQVSIQSLQVSAAVDLASDDLTLCCLALYFSLNVLKCNSVPKLLSFKS